MYIVLLRDKRVWCQTRVLGSQEERATAVQFLTAVIDATDAPPAEKSLASCLRGLTRIEMKDPVQQSEGLGDLQTGLDKAFPGAASDILEVVQHVGEHRGMLPLSPSAQACSKHKSVYDVY